MHTVLDELAGEFGAGKPRQTSDAVVDDHCGVYHNPVVDTETPHSPAVSTKQPFGAKGDEQ